MVDVHKLCVRRYREGVRNGHDNFELAESAMIAAFEPTITKLVETLTDGKGLIESAYSHVSHGGPTRADAEKWIGKVCATLAEIEKESS